jgi:integrative and conjugative element protein (TIGR02256 family)
LIVPWFVGQPHLFKQEQAGLRQEFPEMTLDSNRLAQGAVAFEGTFAVNLGAETESVTLALEYPAGFPYLRPDVIPIMYVDGKRAPRFFSARHQMANGSVCLFERDPRDNPYSYITGVLALRRARVWLPHALRGSLPDELDTLEAELDGHYIHHGNVFLGPMMFEALGNGGQLILDAFHMSTNEEYPLYMVTHVETEGSWQDDRETLQRLGTSRPAAFWDGKPPAERLAVRWFDLKKEPPPIRSASELAPLLFPDDAEPMKRLKRELASALTSRSTADVPLRFPGRRPGTVEWLFLHFRVRDKSLPKEKIPGLSHAGQVLDFSGADALDSAQVFNLRVQDLRRASLVVRNATRVPTGTSTLALSFAGAGALGSAVIDLLAKAGLGRMRIVDPGSLDAQNAVRHLAGANMAGAPKGFVVGAIACAHNPHCKVSWLPGSVLDLSLSDRFWTNDAVVSTIADDATELALNRIAVALGKTVYYLRGLRSGSAGRLVRVRPGRDACFECLAYYDADGGLAPLVVPPEENELIGRECGQPVLAASAADLAIIGGLGTRKLLSDVAAPGTENQWVWAVEGIEGHSRLQAPFSTAAISLPPHPQCPICGTKIPRSVVLPAEIRRRILDLATAKAPNETGGILVGRREGDTLTVVSASDAGPKAISEPTRFQRDGKYCQDFLLNQVRQLGADYDYVGEWHSHPGTSPEPSARDTDSFTEIAEDPDVLTAAPLLIIVTPDGADGRWTSTIFPVGGLAKALPIVDALPGISGSNAGNR